MIIDGALLLIFHTNIRPYTYSPRRGRFLRLLHRSVLCLLHYTHSRTANTITAAGLWSTSLVDTYQAYANALSACATSPPCPLHTPNGSLASLQERVDSILGGLRDNPLPVVISGESGLADNLGENYGLLTLTLARYALFRGLYKPRQALIPWFRALLAVSNGDGKEMYELSQRREALFRCDCSSSSSRQGGLENEMEITTAIACSDAVPFTGGTETAKKVQEGLQKDSRFGDLSFTMSAMCR
jgi:hypothetical protein